MATASTTSPRCTVCAHAERLVIDHTLACGAEHRATGRRFGLSKDAISRHWANHVSETWKLAMTMGPYGSRAELEKLCLDEGKSVLEGLRALYSSHHALMVANREAGATQAYITVAREIRATLNDIGRLTGEILPNVSSLTVNQTFNSVAWLSSFGEDLVAEFSDMPLVLDRLHGVLKRRMTAALPAPETIDGVAHAA